jgi:hypothetical protein
VILREKKRKWERKRRGKKNCVLWRRQTRERERKRRRGKKIVCCREDEPEREKEKVGEKEKKRKKKLCAVEKDEPEMERKNDKIRMKVATVNFQIWKFTVAYLRKAFRIEGLLELENGTKSVKFN